MSAPSNPVRWLALAATLLALSRCAGTPPLARAQSPGRVALGIQTDRAPAMTPSAGTFVLCDSNWTCRAALDSATVARVRNFLETPPAPGPCEAGTGTIGFDAAGYLYLCVPVQPSGASEWRRTAEPLRSAW